jgi:predicted DCC family thiol-disulfide oxidoreductase YuxK
LENPIVIFDGVCNLCNGAVRFLIKHDKYQNLRFASIQSPGIQDFLSKRGISSLEPESILLYKNGEIFDKSIAIYEILNYLPNLKFLKILFFLHKNVNDRIYNFVARNRYRFFGKKNECMLPSSNQKHLFITELSN